VIGDYLEFEIWSLGFENWIPSIVARGQLNEDQI
jgi:hypothetical protein